ncbi:uncharacterized protein [Halyomorpha halys]|uniref:uncharacterized protein n=1 Tax=Halyomorpha halys TaxID=286706 RepID=UPI0006D4E4C2
MAFEDHKKFWKEFIELYKEQTCLWDNNSKDYSNRNARNRAYDALVAKCREKFPNAEKYFVAKKINSLRTSFRRQFRKIQESTNEVVEPTLWYFDLLLFTLDQEELRPGVAPSMRDDLGDDDFSINETDLTIY